MGKRYKLLEHKHFNEIFKDSIYKDGIETFKLSSWKDFEKVEEIFSESKKRYIWRGQRKDWLLKSTFDRHPFYNKLTNLDESGEIREKILETLFNIFKQKLVELEKENKLYNIISKIENLTKNPENYIWATGQHYGLPTPILDWTESLYISAYFAFHKKCNYEQCDRIVYALNIKTLKRMLDSEKQRFVDYPDLNEDFFDDILKERIKRQKSKFTRALNGKDIEENVMKLVEIKPEIREKEVNILTKIFIPDKLRCECLDYLKKMENSITHIKLFPDYHGAVDICKIDLDLDKYKTTYR